MGKKRWFKVRYQEENDDEYKDVILDERRLTRIFGNDAKYILHKIETKKELIVKGKHSNKQFQADIVDDKIIKKQNGEYTVSKDTYSFPEINDTLFASILKVPTENIISAEFLSEDKSYYNPLKRYEVKYFTNDYLVELDINQIHEAVLDFDDVEIWFDKDNFIRLEDNTRIYTLVMRVN